MWKGNNKQHIIPDERKKEIDIRRTENGLKPFWSYLKNNGESHGRKKRLSMETHTRTERI